MSPIPTTVNLFLCKDDSISRPGILQCNHVKLFSNQAGLQCTEGGCTAVHYIALHCTELHINPKLLLSSPSLCHCQLTKHNNKRMNSSLIKQWHQCTNLGLSLYSIDARYQEFVDIDLNYWIWMKHSPIFFWFLFLHYIIGAWEIPKWGNQVGADLVQNIWWDHRELYAPFIWFHTKPNFSFRWDHT